jgi:hypothetical protein
MFQFELTRRFCFVKDEFHVDYCLDCESLGSGVLDFVVQLLVSVIDNKQFVGKRFKDRE